MKQAICICWTITFLLCGGHLWGAESRYLKAVSELCAGNFGVGVKEYYLAILLEDPLLSPACLKQDLSEAEKHFRLQLSKVEKKEKPAFFLGLVRRLQGDLSEGNRILDDLRSRHPKSRILTFAKGEFLLAGEKHSEATVVFDLLTKIPKSGQLVSLARHLQQKSGILPTTDAQRKRLLDSAYRCFDLGEYDLAEKKIRTFLGVFRSDEEGARCLIEVLAARERFPEALGYLELWKKEHGQSPIPPIREASLEYSSANFTRAAELLTVVVSEDPANEFARVLLAESHFQKGSFASAGFHFCELAQADPMNIGLVDRSAACLEQTGKISEAIDILKSALERIPDQPLLMWKLALLYENSQSWIEAKNTYVALLSKENPFRVDAEFRLEIVQEKLLESLFRPVDKPQRPASEPYITALPVYHGFVASSSSQGGGGEKPRFQKKSQQVDLLKSLSKLYR